MLLMNLLVAGVLSSLFLIIGYVLFRDYFSIPYGVFLSTPAVPRVSDSMKPTLSSYIDPIVRIWVFYAFCASLWVLTAGSLAPAAYLSGPLGTLALLGGFIVVALARVLCVAWSGFMVESLLAVTLVFFAMLPGQTLLRPEWFHRFVYEGMKLTTPEFSRTFLALSIAIPLTVELGLVLCWRFIPPMGRVSYQLCTGPLKLDTIWTFLTPKLAIALGPGSTLPRTR